MIEQRWSLRTRIALFFVLVGAAPLLLVGGAVLLAPESAEPHAFHRLKVFAIVAAALSTLVSVLVWQLFDQHVARALQRLARDLQTQVHAIDAPPLDTDMLRYLGPVGPASQALVGALTAMRAQSSIERELDERTLREERELLATLVRDINVGVLVATSDDRIVLYNQHALRTLKAPEHLGLSRRVSEFIDAAPIRSGLDWLKRTEHPESDSISLMLRPVGGKRLLRGTMSGLYGTHGQLRGYLLSFTDDTNAQAVAVQRGRDNAVALKRALVSADVIDQLSQNLCGQIPVVIDYDEQASLQRLSAESTSLCTSLQQSLKALHEHGSSAWPMFDFNSDVVFSAVKSRCSTGCPDAIVLCEGACDWLRGDTNLVESLLIALASRLHELDADGTLHMSASRVPIPSPGQSSDQSPGLKLSWQGVLPHDDWLAEWLEEPLLDNPWAMTGQEILDVHLTSLQFERQTEKRCHFSLPLNAAEKHARSESSDLPARPEFYDFNLFDRSTPDKLAERSLDRIDYVIFDTETTGLEPSNGDEIVSIAAVRIVNGRVLTGEVFDELVNPRRHIPAASVRFHGITDEQVTDKDIIEHVLPRFARFVDDAVLVAHNAAFDMKFLSLKSKASKVSFDNPVLDTVLLSAWLHDHTNQHTLDDLAARFGVSVEGRHTALGDAQATAEILVRILPLLRGRGVTTLAEALEVSDRMVGIKRAQKAY